MLRKKHLCISIAIVIFAIIIISAFIAMARKEANPAISYQPKSEKPLKLENSDYRIKNEEYLKEVCGTIIIEYYQKYGTMPESLEDAMVCLDRRLPHRGDYYGGATLYKRINDHSFSFIAFGKNEKSDFGKGDDIVVTYDTDKWL